MALIQCTECGQLISEKATKCPHCGAPIQKQEISKYWVIESSNKRNTWGFFLLVVLIGGIAYFAIDSNDDKNNTTETNNHSEKVLTEEIPMTAILDDGDYCYNGEWVSNHHAAQACKREFVKKDNVLLNSVYTNLKYNSKIPLDGTIENNKLHFVGDISGKQLVIDLEISSDGTMLNGSGIDYAHDDEAIIDLVKFHTNSFGQEKRMRIEAPDNISFSDEEGDHSQVVHSTNAVTFNSNRDYYNYFSSPKKYKGRLAFSEGVIEIKKEDDIVNVYVNDHHLSALGFTHKNQKYLFGDYIRMFVYCEGRTYPVVIHLPDKEHPYGYFYFDPMQTSTDERLVMAMGIPKTEGWLWVEPDIQEGKATLIWHTDATSRPAPEIFRLIE